MRVSAMGRLLVVACTVSVIVFALNVPALMASARRPMEFASALVLLVIAVHLALSVWVVISASLLVMSNRSALARRWSLRFTPTLLRAAIISGAASGLAFAPLSAQAAVSVSGTEGHQSLTGLRLPDRPVNDANGAAPSQTDRSVVTVVAGDTLWAIAARSLPASSGNAEVASECARWYATNRSVIGPDPDLIAPTMVLRAPSTKDAL